MGTAEQERSRVHVNQFPDDTSEELRTLLSALRERFGDQLTTNPDRVPSGADAETYRQRLLEDCAVLVVTIGPNWLAIARADVDQPHQEGPAGWVRGLLASALADARIEVIPVMMGMAQLRAEDLPEDLRPLASLPSVEVRGVDWAKDTERLSSLIDSLLRQDPRVQTQRARARALQVAIERARELLQRGDVHGAAMSLESLLAARADHAETLALRTELESALSRTREQQESETRVASERREEAERDEAGHLSKGRSEKPVLLDENVQFTVYRRSVVQPARWYPFLVFAHLTEKRPDSPADEGDPVLEMQAQARQILGESVDQFQVVTSDSRAPVMREGELRVVPAVEGIEFNPAERRFTWSESVHREEFRMRAAAGLHGQTLRGVVTVYSGNLILADVPVNIKVDRNAREASNERSQARPYRRIFASYSHDDVAIVEEFEAHARATGDQYLRDVVSLRAGEIWNDRLLDMIRAADVFQLFWSWNALSSRLVSAEWQFALNLNRTNFVRPVYWEEPLPEQPGLPPPALRSLHFQRVYPRVTGVRPQPSTAVAVSVSDGKRAPSRVGAKWRRFLPTQVLRVAAATIPLLVIAVYIAVNQSALPPLPHVQPPDTNPTLPAPVGPPPPVSPPVEVIPLPGPSIPGSGQPSQSRPAGLAGLSIDEITLQGLVRRGELYLAVMKDVNGKTYTVHPGDRFADGVVRAITAEGVVFIQTVSDPLALEKEREVLKRLRPATQ